MKIVTHEGFSLNFLCYIHVQTRIQSLERILSKKTKGCTKLDHIRYEDIRSELTINEKSKITATTGTTYRLNTLNPTKLTIHTNTGTRKKKCRKTYKKMERSAIKPEQANGIKEEDNST